MRETFAMNLTVLAGGMDPPGLAAATGVEEAVFAARRRLLQAELRSGEPTVESAFAAIQDLEAAKGVIPGDADIEASLTTLREGVLRYLARDYEALLSRPDLDRQLGIVDYARGLHPDDPFLNQLLGAALLRLQRFPEAIPYLERAAAMKPLDVTYQSNLAYAYMQAGRDEEALEILRRLEVMDPENPAIRQVRERVERRLGEKRVRR
jgi:tetratricopeptide (TPR) repeat protein